MHHNHQHNKDNQYNNKVNLFITNNNLNLFQNKNLIYYHNNNDHLL